MKTTEMTVPSMYRYLSERMEYLPGDCILDKGMCGCGGTTLELTSKRNSLILVPTIKKDMGNSSPCPFFFFLFNRTYIQCVFIHFIKFVCLMCLIPMLPLDFISNHP